MSQQQPKFSLYNAGLQDKIFAVNEDHPSPPRPSSARSRVSAKPVPTKRPGSASHLRSRGAHIKPQSDNHRSAHPLHPVPPGHSKKTSHKKDSAVDMRPYQVLGREELLGQLIAVKKKQAASDTVVHQLKAENQRFDTLYDSCHCICVSTSFLMCCDVFCRLESEVSKQQHRIDKILSPQYSKSSHLVLEIRKEIEKSVLVRQLKAQMTSLRTTIAEKDAQIEAMHSNLSSTTMLELSAEKEEYMLEIGRLNNIIAQKDEALEGVRRQAQWNQQERRESANESGDNLRHELDRLTRGYEEVLHRLEVKNAAAGAVAGHNSDMASVKSGSSRKSSRGRPKSSGSARPGSSSGRSSKSTKASSSKNVPMTADNSKSVPKVSSLNELDPELTTFAQQYDAQPQDDHPVRSNADSLTNINDEDHVSKPFNDGYDFNEYDNNMLLTESVDNIPNGGKMEIIADAMDGNLSQVMGGLPLGCKVTANFKGEGTYYKGTVVMHHDDDTYDIEFDDGDMQSRMKRENINVLGEPAKSQPEVEQQAEKSSLQEQQEQGEIFDLQEGARVDLIVNEDDEAMQTGTVVAVLRDGRAFDVEMDSGTLLNNIKGHLLHKSLVLADQLNTLDEKHNQAKFIVGDKVEACYRGKSKWYPGVVSKVRAEGFDIDYDDGEKEYNVKDELIRPAPESAKPNPENTRSPRKSVLRKFRIGQRIEGNYRGEGRWYPGEISKVRTEGFDIDYDDGEKEYNVKDELIRAEPISARGAPKENEQPSSVKFSVGDRVEARYRGKSKFYPGNIGKVRAEGYDIDYDDGEKEYNVKEEFIRKVGESSHVNQPEQEDVVLAKFAVGEEVEARYRGKDKHYPGVIAKVRKEGYDVDYDDGEKEYNVKEELIQSQGPKQETSQQPQQTSYSVGDKVEARYRGKAKWYPGVIGKVRAGGFDVDYDDGEKEYNVNEEFIRHVTGRDFDNTNDTFHTTVESNTSNQSPRSSSGNVSKPKQQLATNDDLNDFLNGLGSDDESELPEYGGGAGLLTEEAQGGYDYGNDFED